MKWYCRIYIFSAWQCGRFAQRNGFHTSLKLGFAGLTLCMVTGALLNSALGNLAALIGYTIVLLFTWPALEALTSENEAPDRVPHMVGVYNCTWSAAAALAYFTGGKLYDSLGSGAVFWLPAAIFLGQFLLAIWFARQAKKFAVREMRMAKPTPHHPEVIPFRQPVSPQTFLKLAWLANPLAYVAVNTLFAVMPGLAQKLGLSPTKVGTFLFRLALRTAGRLRAFVAMDGLALPVPLAGNWIRGVDRELHGDSSLHATLDCCVRANLFRLRRRADVLLVVVLFDGCGRHKRRTRRPARGGDWRGDLCRAGGRRGGAAILPATSQCRCHRRQRIARGGILCAAGNLGEITPPQLARKNLTAAEINRLAAVLFRHCVTLN